MRVIGIISGKGGVGKTTTAANLGAALASQFDKKTVIIDGNFTTPDLGLGFGIYQYAITLDEVLQKGGSPDQAIVVHRSGVRIIPTSSSSYGADVTAEQLRRFIKELDDYDFVIIDSAPGVEEKEVMAILEVCDEVLVVTTPDPFGATDASRMLRTVRKIGTSVRGVELNRAKKRKYKLSVEEVESICEAPVVAVIPESAHVEKSISEGEPVVLNYPHSPAAIGFKKLAAAIAGEPSVKIGLLDRLIWNITYLIKGKAKKPPVVYEKAPATPIPTSVSTPAIKPAPTPAAPPAAPQAAPQEPEDDEQAKKMDEIIETLKKRYEDGKISDEAYEETKSRMQDTLEDRYSKGVISRETYEHLMSMLLAPTPQPAEPKEVEEEKLSEPSEEGRKNLEGATFQELMEAERSLKALEKQYQDGTISEERYKELKESGEKKIAEICEEMESDTA